MATRYGNMAYKGIILVTLLALVAAFLVIRPVGAQSSPPGAPTGLTAKAVGATLVELSWTAPAAGRASVTGYTIEHSDDNAAAWKGLGNVPNTEVSKGQNAGMGVQTYYSVDAVAGKNLYRVSAINSAGSGDPSGRVSVTPPVDGIQPDAPTAVTATANGYGEINLSWPKVPRADAGAGPVTQYKIEYSKDGKLPWMELATTNVTNTDDGTKYSNKNLAPNTTRHYRVSAVNIGGRGPVETPKASAKTALAGVPAAPTGLTAKAVGEKLVELYWTAPSAGGAPIENYKIETFDDKGATWTDSVALTEVANTDSGVQTYHAVVASPSVASNLYRVSAINTIGTGPVSATVTVTPPVDGTQPGDPTVVTARADGTSEIEVSWTAPIGPAVGPVTQYKIEYSKDGRLPWMELATTPGAALRYEHTGLAPATTRHYRVSAVNKAGRGPVSTPVVSATTAAEGPLSVTGPSSPSYAENDTAEVGTYTAQGPNAASVGLFLDGTDRAYFRLNRSSTGTYMLKFTTAPDYENPRDANKDNVYELTVKATQGANTDVRTVVVTVTNVDELGTIQGDSSFNHEENVMTVGTYTVTEVTARWTVEGTDAGDFRISNAGMLSFRTSPNYESPADANTDNVYMVTVKVTGGGETETKAVTITVTDVDEDGSVALSPQHKVGTAINATLSDGDGNTSGTTWQWAKSGTAAGSFDDISGATNASYTPVAADIGMYLRATASYTDGYGPGKSAMKVSSSVRPENTAPTFPAATATRSIAESAAADMNIGDPVAATDADNDSLTYALGGTGMASFAIDPATGQLKTKAALDYETTMTYTVMVTATDPDGESASIDVTINVTDVDEVVTLKDRYDANDNGKIDRDEVLNAIDDFFDPDVITTREQVVDLIDLFFEGLGS